MSLTRIAPLRGALVALLLASACVLPSSVTAQEAASGIKALRAFATDLERFSAGFEQVILSADGAVMEEGEGEVWLETPDLFRWAYYGDFPELIVADGDRVWMYDEGLDQVTVRAQAELAGDSPLLVILDLERLEERFEVTELGTVTGQHLLQLISRSADAQFERLVLGFQDGGLQRLVLEDAFGMRTELAFRDVVRNPELPEGHFRFVPPEGVDVVGDVPEAMLEP